MCGNEIIKEDISDICKEKIDWTLLSGKSILITGANGILASYMVETIMFLLESQIIKNTIVFALSRNIDKAELRFKNYLKNSSFRLIVQDVSDPIQIRERLDIIIHAASQASHKYYGTDPVGTLTPNICGTINLLKLAQEKRVQNFLFFSTAEVYGEIPNNDPIRENDFGPLNPLDIRSSYAESKRMGETICKSWFTQFGIPVKIVRIFHTYGPGLQENDGRLFADFVFDIINNRSLLIKSDGSARRAYCYVSDAILGYFYVLLKGIPGEAYNVGNPYQEYSVKELASLLIEMFPKKSLNIVFQPGFNSSKYLPSKVNRFLPDIQKIETLGWKPKTNAQKGFYRTIIGSI